MKLSTILSLLATAAQMTSANPMPKGKHAAACDCCNYGGCLKWCAFLTAGSACTDGCKGEFHCTGAAGECPAEPKCPHE
ncbi:hypothetical protein EJ03DRAFT_350220 [Teratosphaeria nubilosa]|uniref:Uncharacterized protein n=1 Tax=Teratosphaeria nubilosa TaxID=161662 RepID=A0A6G1LDW8_9PEZI|nr:hypothetical protein EJ03DRAFT_350220 [Teratosphaeria nubilosa]